jgi:D-serine deaminase-like pyridoxal phosphate-dependent protein
VSRHDDHDRLADAAVDTPEVVVDLVRVEANIARVAAIAEAGHKQLRPHIKTHKMPEIARMQVDAGAIGIQTAKLGEAEVMAREGFDDILIAFPVVGAAKLRRLVNLAARVRISVCLDSFEVAEPLSRALAAENVRSGIVIEVDTGLRRTGLPPGESGALLAERVAELPALDFQGVLTHEGHIYTRATTDAERERMTRDACDAIVTSAEEIRSRGIDCKIVSVGATPSLRFAARCEGITELGPGTYVFNDRTQLLHGSAAESDLGAFVVATVVSCPERGRVIVDAGSKALTSDRLIVRDAPQTFGCVYGRPGWEIVRLSEEHGVIALPPGCSPPHVGDRLVLVPNHICPVMNLVDSVTILGADGVAERHPVLARGRVQ